jgi:hypothetical protein
MKEGRGVRPRRVEARRFPPFALRMKLKLASLSACIFLAALSASALAQTSTLPITSLLTAATPLTGLEYFLAFGVDRGPASEPQEPQKALFLFEALNVCGFTTNRLSEFEDFFVGDREVDCGQRQVAASARKFFSHVVGQALFRHVVRLIILLIVTCRAATILTQA